MRLKRLPLITFGSLLVLLGARTAYTFHRWHGVLRDFEKIQSGQTTATVQSMLGAPNYHSGRCLQDLRISDKCSSELVYSHPFAPFAPEYVVVDFDANGKVIAAGHLISP